MRRIADIMRSIASPNHPGTSGRSIPSPSWMVAAIILLCAMATTRPAAAQSLAARAWDIIGQKTPAAGRVDSVIFNWRLFGAKSTLPSPAFRLTSDTLPTGFDLRRYLRPSEKSLPAHDSSNGSFFLPDQPEQPEMLPEKLLGNIPSAGMESRGDVYRTSPEESADRTNGQSSERNGLLAPTL